MQETSNRRIVIGDVHGHYNGLMGLLEAIALLSSTKMRSHLV